MPFKKTKDKTQKKAVPEVQAGQQAEQTASIEQFNSSVDMSFFYTSDKKLNAIDDTEILKQI